jgi:hypothetical protein
LDNDWLLDRIITDDLKATAAVSKVDTMFINDTLMNDLRLLVTDLKSRGTQVILVANPYYPPYGTRIPKLDAYIRRVEQETGQPVYNYTAMLTDPKYFGDLQHVNVNGAKVFLDKMLVDVGLVK